MTTQSTASTVSASVTLESRSLHAELRVTVDTARPQFGSESHLTNLHENAEALLPAALLSEGMPALRSVLQKCEALLLDQHRHDVSLLSPKNLFPARSFLKANGLSTLVPELLAALIALRERHQIDDPHHADSCEFCQMADAAIIKAREA